MTLAISPDDRRVFAWQLQFIEGSAKSALAGLHGCREGGLLNDLVGPGNPGNLVPTKFKRSD